MSTTFETAAAYTVRGRRQAVAVLSVATLFGIWLGTSAPGVSPVATPPAAVQTGVEQNAADQNAADRDPFPPDPGGPARVGRRR